METPHNASQFAVVIPCYRVKEHILGVIAGIPEFVNRIYIVDDACPEHTGDHVQEKAKDPRVQILRHVQNQGVGGAMITGYRQALADGCDVIAKLDGDGQMDGKLLAQFMLPVNQGQADYTKGNRFYLIESLRGMPAGRIAGNAVLSFVTKLSSGYWHVFDPTNGYTCISRTALALLPLDKISKGYFFESDMLFRLNSLRAVILDIPMQAAYHGEESNLSFMRNAGSFMKGHLANFAKRIVYNYFLRNFSLASVELLMGSALLLFGTVFGLYHWSESIATGHVATTGTVMVAVLPIIIGFQLLMSFLNYDVANQPTKPITPLLK
jgi:glycosyltransferase involved in cell wall biosynthesis